MPAFDRGRVGESTMIDTQSRLQCGGNAAAMPKNQGLKAVAAYRYSVFVGLCRHHWGRAMLVHVEKCHPYHSSKALNNTGCGD